jgi:quercetin dioxygenase-like cupin family protein
MSRPRDIVVAALDPAGWTEGAVPGLREKRLWERAPGDASIALLRFERGAGVPRAHQHPSNQFMYCLAGRYAYPSSDIVLEPGSFYWNPAGNRHGPTEALEESLLLEVYDGRHDEDEPAGGEEESAGERLDRVGTRLLHSNELVNVWDVTLAPGEQVPWHRHRYPYVVVTIDAGRSAITDRATGARRLAEGAPGSVVYDPGGALHRLENVGEVTIRDRLIEFKTAPAGLRPPRVHVDASGGQG